MSTSVTRGNLDTPSDDTLTARMTYPTMAAQALSAIADGHDQAAATADRRSASLSSAARVAGNAPEPEVRAQADMLYRAAAMAKQAAETNRAAAGAHRQVAAEILQYASTRATA